MVMRVYGVGASPFVQRVLTAGRIKGHELPLAFPPGGAFASPEFRAISPLARIPVLDHDGWTLAESGAIVAYLDEVLEGPSLFPGDARHRARIRLIESLVMCELGGLRDIMTGIVFGMGTDPAVIAAGKAQAQDGLAALDRVRMQSDRFAIGDAPSAADCALIPLLTLLEIVDVHAGTLALLAKLPGLADYRARMDADPVIGRAAHEMRVLFPKVMARRADVAARETQMQAQCAQ